jgi:hypothetical protein
MSNTRNFHPMDRWESHESHDHEGFEAFEDSFLQTIGTDDKDILSGDSYHKSESRFCLKYSKFEITTLCFVLGINLQSDLASFSWSLKLSDSNNIIKF